MRNRDVLCIKSILYAPWLAAPAKSSRICIQKPCLTNPFYYVIYICVDEMGNIIPPNYVTEAFPKLLARHGMRHIRFHDLRHTCASMLLKNGVPMKQIQEWLGHSDFSTTANIYAHLDYNSKLNSAEAMVEGMKSALNSVS